jgi:glycosyltransferase involved in cell wall biosynthesis
MSRVSIVVLNYNYARFVGLAIESALRQTHRDVEVIVVDNGSTDASPEVIRPYESRVRLVRQPVNIGQGQGYNLGIEAATGEWIVWLDADDLLDDDCIATCLSLATEHTAKVQFPMRHIDGEGAAMGTVTPSVRHFGDVRPIIRRFGHYAGPPGSGNLYRRSAVAPYFPVCPAEWPICTDTVPFVTAPFHGDVVDTQRPLGSYRLHRRAASNAPGYRGNFSLSMASEVSLNYGARDKTLAMLREKSGIDIPGPFLTLPAHVRHRIISWRWAPQAHPFPKDSATQLWRLMRDSLRACPGYSALDRTLMLGWAAAVLFLPAPLAHRVMEVQHATPFWELLTHKARRQTA